MKRVLRFSKVREVKSPQRGTTGSAGIDFFIPEDFKSLSIAPSGRVLIPSGIKADIPEGYALIAFNKSGVAANFGLVVGSCVIDSDYQGEIHISLINTGESPQALFAGQKIVQFLLMPVDHCYLEVVKDAELFTTETERAAGGFGSTGIK